VRRTVYSSLLSNYNILQRRSREDRDRKRGDLREGEKKQQQQQQHSEVCNF